MASAAPEFFANMSDTTAIVGTTVVATGLVVGGYYALPYLAAAGSAAAAKIQAAGVVGTALYASKNAITAGIETGVEAGIASWMGDESFDAGWAFTRNFSINMAIGWIPGASESKLSGKLGARAAVMAGKYGLGEGMQRAAYWGVRGMVNYGKHCVREVAVNTFADTAWGVGIEGRNVGNVFTQSLVGNMIGQGIGDWAISPVFRKVMRHNPFRLCFVAGTVVQRPGESRFTPIEQIRLGSRVATYVPAEARRQPLAASVGASEPRPVAAGLDFEPGVETVDWRRLVLRATDPRDADVEVELLRSVEWVEAHGAAVVAEIWVELPELNFAGRMRVVEVDAAPPIEAGEGRLVTGTFRHIADEILSLAVEGLDAPIRCTPRHPFWSVDREAFIEARDLRPGEQLLSSNGSTVRVVSLTIEQASAPVYNIEVDRDHVYRVTELGLLVHNASWGDRLTRAGIEMPDSIAGLNPHGHHVVMKGKFSHWGDSARRYVSYSQGVLKRYNIDINGLGENVHWAPNRGHSKAYAKNVASELAAIRQSAKRYGWSDDLTRTQILRQLKSIADRLCNETFPT